MRTYELKPTRANLVDTLSNDSIGRNIDLSRFLTILNHIHSCYSIALDGKWGSGKTFFVKQTKMLLDAQNENALRAMARCTPRILIILLSSSDRLLAFVPNFFCRLGMPGKVIIVFTCNSENTFSNCPSYSFSRAATVVTPCSLREISVFKRDK